MQKQSVSISNLITEVIAKSDSNMLENIIQTTEFDDSSKNSMLLEIIKSDRAPKNLVELLLKKGASCNTSDNDGRTVLMIAIEKNNEEAIYELLKYNIFINARDRYGKNALFYVIEGPAPSLELVRRLIKKGIDINCEAKDKSTPLIKATERSCLEIAELLIKKQASLVCANDNEEDSLQRNKSPTATMTNGIHSCQTNSKAEAAIDFSHNIYTNNPHKNQSNKKPKSETNIIKEGENEFRNRASLTKGDFQLKPEDVNNFPIDTQNGESGSHFVKSGQTNFYKEGFEQLRNIESIQRNNSNSWNNSSRGGYNQEGENHQQHNGGKVKKSGQHQNNPKAQNLGWNKTSQLPEGDVSVSSNVQENKPWNNKKTHQMCTNGPSDQIEDPPLLTKKHSQKSPHKQNTKQFQNLNQGIDNTTSQAYQNGPGNYKGDNQNTFGGDTPNIQLTENRKSSNSKNINEQLGNGNGGGTVVTNRPSQPKQASDAKFIPEQSFQYQAQQQMQSMQMQGHLNHFQGQPLQFQGTSLQFPGQQMQFQGQNMQFQGQQFPGQYHQMQGQFGPMQGQFGFAQDQINLVQNTYYQMPSNQSSIHFGYGNPQSNPINQMRGHPDQGNRKFHFDLRNSVEKDKLGSIAEGETLNMKVTASTQKKAQFETQETELTTLLDETSEATNQLIKKDQQLHDKLKESKAKIQAMEKEIADLEQGLIEDPSRPNKIIATTPVNAMSSTLSYLTQNTRDARLSDWQIEHTLHKNIYEKLSEDILSFEKWVDQANQKEEEIIADLISKLKQAVSEVLPNAECLVYGSYATGLNLPWNVIDIAIKLPLDIQSNIFLEQAEQAFKKKDWIEEARLRSHSKLKLKLVAKKDYMSKVFEISLLENRYSRINAINLIKEYLNCYPMLRQLSFVLKRFVTIQNLNIGQAIQGGISSYPLCLMIVYFLQTRYKEPINVGAALLDFLYFFGYEYDYLHRNFVGPARPPKNQENGKNFLLPNQNIHIEAQNGYRIIIQDPLNINYDAGSKITRVSELKKSFSSAYIAAHLPCICEFHKGYFDLNTFAFNRNVECKACTSILPRIFGVTVPQSRSSLSSQK